MSTEAAKKRGRPKRAALEGETTVVVTKAVGSATTAAVRAKVTRLKKEDAEGVEKVASSAKTIKVSKVKKISKVDEGSTSVSSSSSKTKTNSKRTAAAAKKPAEIEVNPCSAATLSPPLSEERSWSIILEQARAFSTTSRSISEQVHELVEGRKGQLERGERGTEPAASASASASANGPATNTTATMTTATTTTTMAAPSTPQSAFVSSFLNDPEPTPTPPTAPSRRKLDEYSIDEPTEPQANADMISSIERQTAVIATICSDFLFVQQLQKSKIRDHHYCYCYWYYPTQHRGIPAVTTTPASTAPHLPSPRGRLQPQAHAGPAGATDRNGVRATGQDE
ncbi:hypothetical protein DV736_g4798, partial [Chaetothyriales sp. CBS 134916]